MRKYLIYIYNETKDQRQKVTLDNIIEIMENGFEKKIGEIKEKEENGKNKKEELKSENMMGQIEEIKDIVEKNKENIDGILRYMDEIKENKINK